MDVFVARQPIFDRRRGVHAYELLFRSGLQNFFDHAQPDQASSSVLSDSISALGLEELTGGRPAFVNFTQGLLEAGTATLLPEDWLVVEILEDVSPTEEVLAACRRLKQAGYRLALDDFVYHPQLAPLLELADIVKIDWRLADQKARTEIQARSRELDCQLLAEKIETEEEFNQAKAEGYDFFQGYFFCRPTVITGHDIPAWKMQSLMLIKESAAEDLDFKAVAGIVRQELSLTYKLLRYINSPFFGIRVKIKSVDQALTMLGEENIRKWLSLVAMANLAREGTAELPRTSFLRAVLCESLGCSAGLNGRETEVFMVGLFSLIDVVLSRPMADILPELQLPDDVEAALRGEDNILGRLLALAVSYDRGQWDRIPALAKAAGLSEDEIPALYREAVASIQKLGED